jgi:hypothetical protein
MVGDSAAVTGSLSRFSDRTVAGSAVAGNGVFEAVVGRHCRKVQVINIKALLYRDPLVLCDLSSLSKRLLPSGRDNRYVSLQKCRLSETDWFRTS